MDKTIFDNGAGLTKDEYEKILKSAKGQDKRVLDYYEQHPTSFYSAEEIWSLVFNEQCPLTSVRRSLSSLSKKGILGKDMQHKKPGSYDIAICTYYRKQFVQPQMEFAL